MKKIPLIGALLAAIFVAIKALRRKKQEPDTGPGEGRPTV